MRSRTCLLTRGLLIIRLDTQYSEKKMKVLGYPYSAEDIRILEGKTEMDALVSYLLRLGKELKP